MKSFMWSPINMENRSGSCSEKRGRGVAQAVNAIPRMKFRILRSAFCIPRARIFWNYLRAPRMAFSLRGWSWSPCFCKMFHNKIQGFGGVCTAKCTRESGKIAALIEYRLVHQDYTYSLIFLELVSVLVTLTLTPFIVLRINYKSVIGALWDYTCTPEITLTLLNCFQINFPKIPLTLTLLLAFELQM